MTDLPPAATGRVHRPLLHPLAGATLAGLLRVLAAHGGIAPRHAGQLAVMIAGALLRWPFYAAESLRVARRVASVRFDPPPVFIVGHWRSGTTLLHHLLAQDGRFCFPNVVDAFRPFEFYPSPFAGITRRLILASLPAVRPMDEVQLRPEHPQEEELALAAMAAPSFMNCLYFPRTMARTFAREVLLEDGPEAEAGHGAATQQERWSGALRYFLAKVQALHPGRRLLVKNPANSARVPLLRQLFPGARFIHIHREPLAVFASTRRFYLSMLPVVALQDYDPAQLDAHILRSYRLVMDRLLPDLEAMPAGTVATVGYDDLATAPLAALEQLYGALDLGGFAQMRPRLAAHIAEHPVHAALPARTDADAADGVAAAWHDVIHRLGYPVPGRRVAHGVAGLSDGGAGCMVKFS